MGVAVIDKGSFDENSHSAHFAIIAEDARARIFLTFVLNNHISISASGLASIAVSLEDSTHFTANRLILSCADANWSGIAAVSRSIIRLIRAIWSSCNRAVAWVFAVIAVGASVFGWSITIASVVASILIGGVVAPVALWTIAASVLVGAWIGVVWLVSVVRCIWASVGIVWLVGRASVAWRGIGASILVIPAWVCIVRLVQRGAVFKWVLASILIVPAWIGIVRLVPPVYILRGLIGKIFIISYFWILHIYREFKT